MIESSVRDQFAAGPGYLNTASVGLPPRRAVDALRRELDDWEAGRCEPASYDVHVDRVRSLYAELVGAERSSVAILGAVSAMAGVVASSLPDGAHVLCAEEDFTSVLFPFMADDRLRVTLVPLERLLDRIATDVDLVAVSAVQSADGRALDLDALESAARDASALTYVDVTQAAGWRSIDAARFDVTGCGAYKWLCSPRGTGFMTVRPGTDWLLPRLAGWYSSASPWTSIYGPPLRIASDARRFNLSPPWFDIVSAAESLALLADIGVVELETHAVSLANRFRALLEMPASDSAIVAIDTDRGDRLREAGIAAAVRAGKVRLSFWLYNTTEDAEMAASIILE